MHDIGAILLVALAGAAVVAVPGALAHRLLRGRSITAHILLLLVVTVATTLAGVIAVARGMFISHHDLRVLILVLSMSALISLAMGLALARRLAADAMWAEEARTRERRIEASRRDLVAWVSHDLRTPLAGLRAMSEALEDGVVTDAPTVAEYHRRIRAETDRMARLVDDLFELSRINAGALRLTLRNVALGDVVSDALASAGPVASAKRVALRTADGSQWPTVLGSERELARVVANLLRNAIRYTPADGTVTVSGGRDESGGWLAVSDTCGGIPEQDLPRVFDVAFRGEAARTPALRPGDGRPGDGRPGDGWPDGERPDGERADGERPDGERADGERPDGERADGERAAGEVAVGDRADLDGGGGGLGLAIVRGIVEAHRGEVAVDNAGAGCRFVVRLPFPA